MARPPITAKGELLFRKQLEAALDYIEGLSGSGSTDPEIVRDTMATALVAGPNVTITVDDPGDTITIEASSSGGATGGTAILNFGAAPGSSTASVAVTGQTGILTTSRVRAWIQGSTADFNEYEHSRVLPLLVGLGISDLVAGTGFTIQAATQERLTGQIDVNWEWA